MAGPVAGLLSLGVGSTPASPPPTGFTFMWVSDVDGLVYKMDDGGVVSAVGGGALPNPIPLPLLFAVPVPPPGQVSLYASTFDRKVYSLDSFGVTSGPFGAGGGGGAVSPAENELYVDPVGGNDGTGTRGDISKPYQTLQAAINDAFSNDRIKLAAGAHTQNGPFVWGTLTGIQIIGPGSVYCLIQNVAFFGDLFVPPGDPTVFPFTTFQSFGLEGVAIVNPAGGNAILADGFNSGGTYMANYLRLRDVVVISGNVTLVDAGGLYIDGLTLLDPASTLNFSTVSSLGLAPNTAPIKNVLASGDIIIAWDETDADRPGGARPIIALRFDNVQAGGNIILRGEPSVDFFESCSCARPLTDTGLTANGGLAPKIRYRGRVAQYVRFLGALGMPDTANGALFNFDGATISGSFFGVGFDLEVQPGGVPVANRLAASCVGAKCPGGIFAEYGVDLNAQGCGARLVTIYIYGAPGYYTIGDGTIAPEEMIGLIPLPPGGVSPLVVGYGGGPFNLTPGVAVQTLHLQSWSNAGFLSSMANITIYGLPTNATFQFAWAGPPLGGAEGLFYRAKCFL